MIFPLKSITVRKFRAGTFCELFSHKNHYCFKFTTGLTNDGCVFKICHHRNLRRLYNDMSFVDLLIGVDKLMFERYLGQWMEHDRLRLLTAKFCKKIPTQFSFNINNFCVRTVQFPSYVTKHPEQQRIMEKIRKKT